MKLIIDSIHGHGDASEERVLMTVVEDCTLNRYMVADTTYTSSGKLSNKHRHTYWFGTVEAKKGERVALYTKKGSYSKSVHAGVTWHKCYWNSGSPIWNDEGDAAVLFEINTWKTTRVKPTS
ncbi:hypothetical protein HX792_20900 [Pseudomonas sp. B6002]|uniref:hypothetical protein n=1 Tax=Pseudomonas sp. B6002 TaxID=2726978 RepID=UPI0015A4B667|nr:hypothetical protein [Pseudomonas sp. B6002]NVZ52817.1 hypothetical protein [Pseudomonas sp. B6002]